MIIIEVIEVSFVMRIHQTKRELRIKISGHRNNIGNKDQRSCLGRHGIYGIHGLRFIGIEAKPSIKRSGDDVVNLFTGMPVGYII